MLSTWSQREMAPPSITPVRHILAGHKDAALLQVLCDYSPFISEALASRYTGDTDWNLEYDTEREDFVLKKESVQFQAHIIFH